MRPLGSSSQYWPFFNNKMTASSSQHRLHGTIRPYWALFTLFASARALVPPVQSAVSGITVTSSVSGVSTPSSGPDFSSALAAEASILHDLARLSSSAVVPLPSNVHDIPEYKAVAKLAAGPLPPIQAGVGLPTSEEMIANLVAQANTSSTKRNAVVARQSSLRVMIVGDSISHGQQGDYTWR